MNIRMRVPQKKTGLTKTAYAEIEWPRLCSILLTLLNNPISSHIPDNLYNIVYKICTAGLMVRCYNNLRDFISEYLDTLCNSLVTIQHVTFPQTLAQSLHYYRLASERICVIFQYLERQYVTKQLHTTLAKFLEGEIKERIIQNKIIKDKLEDLLPRMKPHAAPPPQYLSSNQEVFLSPSVLQQLILCLYELEPKYYTRNPYLFSLYIPGLFPTCDIEKERTISQQYLDRLSPISKGQGNKKRKHYQSLADTVLR